MAEYHISRIFSSDKKANRAVNDLLLKEGIQRDQNLDYTCGIYTDDDTLVASGSCYYNSLRCIAIDQDHQGEGLMNQLISHLINLQFERGFTHLFVYTKAETAKFFLDLGFYKITSVEDRLVFLENEKNGFSSYLRELKQTSSLKEKSKKIAAVVMNANPFTFGHQYLIEQALKENDSLHLFIVSDDSSLIPFEVRKKLIIAGTKQFHNIHYHQTGSYIISRSTFPSYFLKEQTKVIQTQAELDIEIFIEIAHTLDISARFIGEEPFSKVTNIYNEVMQKKLQQAGISCSVIPRKKDGKEIISASKVRLAIQNDNYGLLKKWVPQTTFDYFTSSEAQPVIQKIKSTSDVIHY